MISTEAASAAAGGWALGVDPAGGLEDSAGGPVPVPVHASAQTALDQERGGS